MNYVQADNGNWALAEGAPGSVARVRVEYPVLIERLRGLRKTGASAQDAHFVCAVHGVNSNMERNSLVIAASFPAETHSLDMSGVHNWAI